jgi:hypothetical protein
MCLYGVCSLILTEPHADPVSRMEVDVSRMEVDGSSGNSGTSTSILHFGTHVMVNFRPLWKV